MDASNSTLSELVEQWKFHIQKKCPLSTEEVKVAAHFLQHYPRQIGGVIGNKELSKDRTEFGSLVSVFEKLHSSWKEDIEVRKNTLYFKIKQINLFDWKNEQTPLKKWALPTGRLVKIIPLINFSRYFFTSFEKVAFVIVTESNFGFGFEN